MNDLSSYRTVHRFLPATEKHDAKTACGIKLISTVPPLESEPVVEMLAADGGPIAVSEKGKKFDCKRCRLVLERHHANRMTMS